MVSSLLVFSSFFLFPSNPFSTYTQEDNDVPDPTRATKDDSPQKRGAKDRKTKVE